jgi:RNA polymerase sigma factor (sigma-70 family)
MYKNKYPGIDPLAVSIALNAARRAAGRGVMGIDDLPDLEQELVLAALNALQRFDPERGNKGALIKTAVTRQLIDLLRYRCNGSRDYRMTSSLNKELHSEGSEFSTLLDMVASDGTLGGFTLEQINPYDQEFTNQHIRESVENLPPPLRDLCYDLQQMPVSQVAVKRKVCPRTVRRNIMKIRQELENMEKDHAR